jgi:hypothetical protein
VEVELLAMTHHRSSILPTLLVLAQLGCGSDKPSGGTDAAIPGADVAVSPSDASSTFADLRQGIDGPVTYTTWPAEATVAIASVKNAFGANMSGLVYEPAGTTTSAVLWAVQNEPSKLYRLTWNGSAFTQVTSEGWVTGKLLRYPGGTGSPDTEGMTRTDWSSNEVYVSAERDNDANQISRQSILRYELTGTKGVLDATHEWLLTSDLPAAELNCGLEGIAWIPDSHLVARGFFDESTQAAYVPSLYPDHGAGVFLVSYDSSGMIYGYVLDHTTSGKFTRVATFASGQTRAVDLTFDRDTGTLWSLCDSKCDGRMTLLDIDSDPSSATAGRFILRATVSPPKALSNMNNEGFSLAPVSECSGDRRSFFWADDGETNGYSMRKGAITCGRLY